MRALARPLVAGAFVAAALLATPAQAAPAAAPACEPVTACLVSDPFWLFRPCGPLLKCP
jgi:hypothetical protein